eukprot:627376-Rhodomonas_salina.6
MTVPYLPTHNLPQSGTDLRRMVATRGDRIGGHRRIAAEIPPIRGYDQYGLPYVHKRARAGERANCQATDAGGMVVPGPAHVLSRHAQLARRRLRYQAVRTAAN